MSRTIVFVHGNFVSRHCWDAWVPHYAARGYTCVPIAYPGRDRPNAELRRSPDVPLLRGLTLQKTLDHHIRIIEALPEKPILIGHSFGGLLTQLLLQRDLGVAGVVIDSVPPPGVPSFEWSFYRGTWPILNPFAGSKPYMMSFKHFQYAFANDLDEAAQRAGWERDIVPESRVLSRGGLGKAAKVDFSRPHPPLLLIGSEKDHIMPAAVNRRNHRRYRHSPSIAEFRTFPGRSHYSVIAGPGWQEVADYALDWVVRVTESAPAVAH